MSWLGEYYKRVGEYSCLTQCGSVCFVVALDGSMDQIYCYSKTY